jgi:hypothetical protein
MPREQVSVVIGDDPDDSSRVQVVVAGVGESRDKSYFFDGQFDQEQLLSNLAICKQINNLGHVATDDFRRGINSRGGVECTDKTRYLVSVSLVSPGRYAFAFGSTVDVPETGFELDENQLDEDVNPRDISSIMANIKTFCRIRGITQMDSAAYCAINAWKFWR